MHFSSWIDHQIHTLKCQQSGRRISLQFIYHHYDQIEKGNTSRVSRNRVPWNSHGFLNLCLLLPALMWKWIDQSLLWQYPSLSGLQPRMSFWCRSLAYSFHMPHESSVFPLLLPRNLLLLLPTSLCILSIHDLFCFFLVVNVVN